MAPIIGLCRFSFLGRGDWRAWRGDRTPADEAKLRQLVAVLYNPSRMEERFWTFENLLLPSVLAQSDQNFHMIVLTSGALPEPYQHRLKSLVAQVPQVHLEISDADNVNDGLFPVIHKIRGAQTDSVQFRIDDDDCLSVDFIERLADFSRRMEGFGSFSYSRPVGLMVSSYAGDEIRYFTQDEPFHSVGTAMRVTNPQRTVFSFGHFGLQRRFPSFLDWAAPAFLAIKKDGHDSLPMVAERLPRGFAAISQERFAQTVASAFPFVQVNALETWLRQGAAENPKTSVAPDLTQQPEP